MRETHDSKTGRNWMARTVHLVIVCLMAMMIPTWFISAFFPPFWPFGLVVGGSLLIRYWHKLVFSVPEFQALVSLNIFTGNLAGYGPGVHPRYLWEEVHKEGNISLKEVTEKFTQTFLTQDASIEVEISWGYRPLLRNIVHFRSLDPSTIKDGFEAFMESTLSTMFAPLGASALRGTEEEISHRLKSLFEDNTVRASLEDQYGIDVTFVKVNRFKLPKEVQEARDAAAEREILEKMVAAHFGYSDVASYRKALQEKRIDSKAVSAAWEIQLALSGETERKDVHYHIDGDPLTGSLLAVADAFTSAGKEVKGAVAGASKKGGKK